MAAWRHDGPISAPTQTLGEPINAGVPAYGPDQVSRRIEDEVDWLRPDLLLVSIFADNDFGDLVRNKMFAMEHGRLKAASPVVSPQIQREFTRAHSPFMLPRAVARALDRLGDRFRQISEDTAPSGSIVSDRAEELLRESRTEYEEYVVLGNTEVTNLLNDHYDADVSLTPRADSARYKTELMGKIRRVRGSGR